MHENGLNGKIKGKQIAWANEPEDEEINLRELLGKYLGYWKFFTVTIILSMVGAIAYLRTKPPVYKSTISILVEDDAKKSGKDMSQQLMSELMMGSSSNLANELELVKSYTTMTKVVQQLGIDVEFSRNDGIREMGLYKDPTGAFVQFHQIKDTLGLEQNNEVEIVVEDGRIWWLAEDGKKEIRNGDTVQTPSMLFSLHLPSLSVFEPNVTYKAIWNTPEEMAKALLQTLEVAPLNKEASIMTISLESTMPQKARDILNALSAAYNKAGVEKLNREADSTINFIDARLALIAGELGSVEKELQNFRETNNVIAIQGQENFQLDRLKTIQGQLDALDIQMQVADMVSEYVGNTSRSYSLAPSSLGIQDPALLGLVQQYNTLVIKREEMLKTLPPTNVAVTAIEGQLKQLQANIGESAANLKKSYRAAFNQTKRESDQLLASFSTIPRKERQLLDIARQQGIKEKLYLFLLEKREEAAIGRASALGNSSPIDPAYTEVKPVAPKKSIVLAIALIIGLGIPMAYIYVKDLLDNKVVTRNDIIKHTKAPIIGEVSHNKSSERQIVADKSRGVIAEQFRIMRTNLQYFIPGKSNSTILVTSSMPGEGKTFISMNTAAVLAATGKKTVLLEFDMRKPKLAEALNIQHGGRGLSTYLTGNSSLEDVVIPLPGQENLYFIPTGPMPPNPAELLTTERAGVFFKELKEHFQHIIIDSPPTMIVSDSKMLSAYSDICFFVIRQRYTPKDHLKFVNELHHSNTLRSMALVVNDIKLTGARGYHGAEVSYGYGNAYNYDYSHGYGYGENIKKGWRKWWSRDKEV